MRQSKRNVFWILLLFILPIVPYFHVVLLEDKIIWSFFNEYAIFDIYTEHYENTGYLFYYISIWFTQISIIIILYRLSNNWIKPFFLFPLVLCISKFIAYAFHFDIVISNKYLIEGLVFAVLGILFIKDYKRYTMPYFKASRLGFFNWIAIILLSCLPFLHELWHFLPDGTNTIDFFLFKVHANEFPDANSAFYLYIQKICFLVPCLIYFIMERKWYRFVLLSPIVIYSAQLFNAVFIAVDYMDEIEFIQTLKFTIPLFIMLIGLAKVNEYQEKIQLWLKIIIRSLKIELKQSSLDEKT